MIEVLLDRSLGLCHLRLLLRLPRVFVLYIPGIYTHLYLYRQVCIYSFFFSFSSHLFSSLCFSLFPKDSRSSDPGSLLPCTFFGRRLRPFLFSSSRIELIAPIVPTIYTIDRRSLCIVANKLLKTSTHVGFELQLQVFCINSIPGYHYPTEAFGYETNNTPVK